VPRLRPLVDHELPGTAVLNTVRARHPGLSARGAFLAEARANLRRDGLGRPTAFLAMTARKVGRMWLEPNRTRAPLTRALHLGIVLLAVTGLIAGVARARSGPLVLLAGMLASVTLVHAVLTAHARHNLPLMPLLIAGGCAGWALVINCARQPQRNSTNASAPVLEPLVGPM
jgi:hypothetical protein